MKAYHFTSRQLVGPKKSAKILEFFDKGLTEHLMFPEERYLQKSKKLQYVSFHTKMKIWKKYTITVSAKKENKKTGAAQKKTDLASSRRYTTREI